jgi:CheY-like chemotaxis protein
MMRTETNRSGQVRSEAIAGEPGGRASPPMRQDRHKIPITILICDDDEDDRLLTQQALEEAHVANDLRFVENGDQLLDYLYQRGGFAGETGAAPRPGLILLDLNMPRMDEREALQVIKADPAIHDIPVVVLTTSAVSEDVMNKYHLGINSFIAKPVTFAGLLEAMNVLGRYWLEIVELPPVAA